MSAVMFRDTAADIPIMKALPSSLSRHVVWHHSTAPRGMCKLCGKGDSNQSYL